jgi:hypothetical protein
MKDGRDMKRRRWVSFTRWLGLVVGGLAVLLTGFVLWVGFDKTPPAEMAWGVTYSAHAARDLGLDPVAAYQAMLDELKPQRLRLVAYWSDVEPKAGVFDYHELDSQVAEAEKRGIPYVIALGQKVPRYPECFAPTWAKVLPVEQQHTRLLDEVENTVRRYDGNAHLVTWQVENEPYLDFGECPKFNEQFLQQEVSRMRQLTHKPLLLTDSGERSLWLGVTQYGDEFGSTLYRVVINDKTGGVFHHFLWPEAYTWRGNLAKKLHPNVKKVIVSELQAEPWGNGPGKPQSFYDLTMGHEQFADNVQFARQVGFAEVYMWGVEWWYYEKLHGDDYYWKTAAGVFAGAK